MTYNCKICGKEIHEYSHTYENDLCYSCQKEMREQQQAQALQSNDITETFYEDDIVCPWCGYRFEDDDGYFTRQVVAVLAKELAKAKRSKEE